jgi:nitroreductase
MIISTAPGTGPRHLRAVLRNWEFFRAPLAGIVCMHRDLGHADALSVGMFLQTLLLALTERGLDSCACALRGARGAGARSRVVAA